MSGSAISPTPKAPYDFGGGILGLTTDGPDFALLAGRALRISDCKYRADGNPGQTLTITLTRNGATAATVSISTSGVKTITGLPLNVAAGDYLVISLTGTTNVVNIAYTFVAQQI